MGDMYPRTLWVHAVRRWLDGEVGPEGEQLVLPGMPEPPKHALQRAWFLVVADFAWPDGTVAASRELVQRRWHIAPRTAKRYWQDMRAAGWVRPVGTAHTGKAQTRQLTIPGWALDTSEDDEGEDTPGRHMGTALGVTVTRVDTPKAAVSELSTAPRVGGLPRPPTRGVGGLQTQSGGPPQAPPEVVRSEFSQVKSRPTVTLVPTAAPNADLTDSHEEDTSAWLTDVSNLTGVTVSPTAKTRAIAAAALAAGFDAPAALDAITATGHNLTRLRAGGLVTLLEKVPTMPKRQPAFTTPGWYENLPETCPHPAGVELGLRPNQCRACRREAGEPQTSGATA